MRIVKGYSPGTKRPPPATAGAAAMRAAMEKEQARYITLVCEHKTTREAQLAYSFWRPKGRVKYFCENCGNWKTVKPKPKAPQLGNQQEPLF